MTLGLRQYALARIGQDDGEVGIRSAGRHVARVLFMAGCIGDDKATLRGREKSVSHVYGDALLAFCLKPINQQCKVNILTHRAVLAAILRDGGERIIHNQAAVIQ